MNIKIKKLKENAVIPTRGSEKAAGYDLYACFEGESLTIPAHSTVKVGTGLAIAIPDGYFGAIFARSVGQWPSFKYQLLLLLLSRFSHVQLCATP